MGTGYGGDKLKVLLPRLKALETSESPFTGAGAPRATAGVHWAKPELVAEIEFAGFTADARVRQAAYKGLREDKPALDVRAATSSRRVRRLIRLRSVVWRGPVIWASKDLTTVSFGEPLSPGNP